MSEPTVIELPDKWESGTPRTDERSGFFAFNPDEFDEYVQADFARQLERELAAMTVKRDALEYALIFCRDDLEAELAERLPNPSKTWCSLQHAAEALAEHGSQAGMSDEGSTQSTVNDTVRESKDNSQADAP